MSENNIQTLRQHLFDTIAALRDKDAPMDIERAKAVSSAAQVVVNSAKVEVDYIKATGGAGSGFIPDSRSQLPQAGGAGGTSVVKNIVQQRSKWQNP
jgi:hypothetical protein